MSYSGTRLLVRRRMHVLFCFVLFVFNFHHDHTGSPPRGSQAHSEAWCRFCLQHSSPAPSAQNGYGTSCSEIAAFEQSLLFCPHVKQCILNRTETYPNNPSCNLLLLWFLPMLSGLPRALFTSSSSASYTCCILAVASTQLCVYQELTD